MSGLVTKNTEAGSDCDDVLAPLPWSSLYSSTLTDVVDDLDSSVSVVIIEVLD